MQCPFCKEEIKDGAIKCKHCGSMLNEFNNQASSIDFSKFNNKKQNLKEKIDQLNIDENLKKVFHMIQQTTIKKMSIGVPIFENEDIKLQPGRNMYNKESIFSVWALALGGIYYLGTGMRKKGILLLIMPMIIGLLFTITIEELFDYSENWLSISISIMFSLWIGMMAKYDRYRRLVLDENFWW